MYWFNNALLLLKDSNVFFVVGKLVDGQASLVEGEEFDEIQPLIESELEERDI